MRSFPIRHIAAAFLPALAFMTSFPLQARMADPLPFGLRNDYTATCHRNVTCTKEAFIDLAFPLSHDGTSRSERLHKWTEPPTVSIALNAPNTDPETIKDIAWALDNVVDGLTSGGIEILKGSYPEDFDQPSIIVVVVDEEDWNLGDLFPKAAANQSINVAYQGAMEAKMALSQEGYPNCQAGIGSIDGRIDGAIIILNLADGADHVDGCLGELTMAAMGFLGDPTIPSLRTTKATGVRIDDLSRFDMHLLRLLNDDLIKPDMTIRDVNETFPEVYARQFPWQVDSRYKPEPVDQETLSCMASIDCARHYFLKMAVTGSALEPRQLDQRVLVKLQIPSSIALVEGDGITDEQREAALIGYRNALKLANALRIPVYPNKPHYPVETARIRAYLSRDNQADHQKAFKPWLETDHRVSQYQAAWSMVRTPASKPGEVICSVNFAAYTQRRYGLHSASAAIPLDGLPPEGITRCVFEEIVQVFGLPSDIHAPIMTLFDDEPGEGKITAFDLLMFALIYHPLLETGMREDQVVARFDRVYHDVWGHFIDHPNLRPTIKKNHASH